MQTRPPPSKPADPPRLSPAACFLLSWQQPDVSSPAQPGPARPILSLSLTLHTKSLPRVARRSPALPAAQPQSTEHPQISCERTECSFFCLFVFSFARASILTSPVGFPLQSRRGSRILLACAADVPSVWRQRHCYLTPPCSHHHHNHHHHLHLHLLLCLFAFSFSVRPAPLPSPPACCN